MQRMPVGAPVVTSCGLWLSKHENALVQSAFFGRISDFWILPILCQMLLPNTAGSCCAAAQAMDWLGIPHAPGSLAAAFQHFLIHTGGRGVLDTIESKLSLTPEQARLPGSSLGPLSLWGEGHNAWCLRAGMACCVWNHGPAVASGTIC